jgi:hypothetical protein
MLFLVVGFIVWALCIVLLVGVCGLASHPPARGLLRRPRSPNPPPRL